MLLWTLLIAGQLAVPQIAAVLPAGATRPTPLAPGMLLSIYGSHLGPTTDCQAKAAPQPETPSPLRPRQSFNELLSYPKELCGVQVMVGDHAAGLLYVSAKQINFKVPQETPVEGKTQLRVIYNGESSVPLTLPLGLEMAALSLDEPAHVGGPVWIRVEAPPAWHDVFQYPITIQPGDFGCHEFEVRRNGVPQLRTDPHVVGGMNGGPGSLRNCGMIAVAGHPGRLPLHLQYRFSQPGVYEVRYTRKASAPWFQGREDVVLQSAWTPITIQSAAAVPIGTPPQDAGAALSEFLPGILGFPDAARLPLVLDYLYHPEETVRRYAANALGYWPAEEVERRLESLAKSRGPSNVVVDQILTAAPDLADGMLKYLTSDNPVLVRGALVAARRVLREDRKPFSNEAKTKAQEALLAAAEHVISMKEQQAPIDIVSLLGTLRDERVHRLLWGLVDRHLVYEQSLIAITWQKDPADLPRLSPILSHDTVDPASRELAMLPYALHNSYGTAALPVLEEALQKSHQIWVQTNCARELMIANRPSGFAFVARAIEEKQRYRLEMIQFLRDRYPELRRSDEDAILAFVKQRAK